MLTAEQTAALRGIKAEDMKAAFAVLKETWRRAGAMAAMSFNSGDTVSFMGRGGDRKVGRVVKTNRNTVTVDCGGIKWRVSGSMLSRTTDKPDGEGRLFASVPVPPPPDM